MSFVFNAFGGSKRFFATLIVFCICYSVYTNNVEMVDKLWIILGVLIGGNAAEKFAPNTK